MSLQHIIVIACFYIVLLPAISVECVVLLFETTHACRVPYYYHPSSQNALYREAFEWNNHAQILRWHYEVMPAVNTTVLKNNPFHAPKGDWDCARVSYSTVVNVPSAMQKFVRLSALKKFKIDIQKTLCVLGDIVLSSVTLANVPFYHIVEVFSKMNFEASNMHTTTQIKYEAPWYLYFCESLIKNIAIQCFMHSIRSIKNQLCAPSVHNSDTTSTFTLVLNSSEIRTN